MTEKSALQKAIEAQPRKTYDFDVSQYLGLEAAAPAGRVKVRVATKLEQDRALVGAHAYAKELALKDEKAANDPDILDDAKSAFIAFECCRDPEKDFPAFNSQRDLMRLCTADQISVFVNLCNEVRAKESPAPKDISSATLESLITMCNEHVGDDIPEAVFANFGREYLTHMVVLLCFKLTEERAKNDVTPSPEAA